MISIPGLPAVDIAGTALRFVRLYGPLAFFVFTFLETSMLFPFLPSEVVVPATAAVMISDVPSFLVFVAAGTAGGTLGAVVLFYAFRSPGSTGLEWLRDRINASEKAVERGKRWFRRWGASSVLWGRFLPGLRSVVSIPAGLAGMESNRFAAYTAVGSAGFYAAAGALVYYTRARALVPAVIDAATANPLLATLAIAGVLAVGAAVWTLYRRQRA